MYLGNAEADANFINLKKKITTKCTWMTSVFQKGKRIGNPKTGSEDIQSGYRDGIWHKNVP